MPALTVLTVDHGFAPVLRARRPDGRAHGRGPRPAPCDPHLGRAASPAQRVFRRRARAARYDLMAAYCHAHDIPALVTAHHSRRPGRDLPDAAQARQRSRWPGGDSRSVAHGRASPCCGRCSMCRRRASSPRCDEAGVSFCLRPEQSSIRASSARGVRGSRDALAALGLTPEALALSARRLRRAREALDRRGARLPRRANSETSEAGYALIDRDGARSGAARDRAPRAGAIDRHGGRRRDAVAARQARVPARRLARRIPPRPIRSAAAGSSRCPAVSASSAR